MFCKKNFGSNISYINPDEYDSLGIHRIETCLGRTEPFERYDKILDQALIYAKDHQIPRSIHLPYLRESYEGSDYLDAFYLDDDEAKRNWNFESLERNIEAAIMFEPDYFVIHFQGVYRDKVESEAVNERVKSSLARLNDIAKKYKVKILVEYFGSHFGFYRPSQWVEYISKLSHIGLLVDTCHLKFSCVMHNLEYYEALETLLEVASACHLWTTIGSGAYGDNEAYKKYHHIAPSISQHEEEGWAFDTVKVLEMLKKANIPVTIEAVPLYHSVEEYKRNIKEIGEYLFHEQ